MVEVNPLSVISFVITIVTSCDQLYQAYKLTRSFGTDFETMQMALEAQFVRLKQISNQKIQYLPEPGGIWDEQSELAVSVKNYLSIMQKHFQTCHELSKKYNFHGICFTSSAVSKLIDIECSELRSNESNNSRSSLPKISSSSSVSSGNNITTHSEATETNKVTRTIAKDLWYKLRRNKNDKLVKNVVNPVLTVTRPPSIQEVSLSTTPTLRTPETPYLGAETLKQSEEAAHLQRTINIYKKCKWVHHDRETFLRTIENLRHGNNDLKNLLQYRTPKNPSKLLSIHVENPHSLDDVENVQHSLLKLHQSLIGINKRGEGQDSWTLAIQLATDYKEKREEVAMQETYLPLRNGSLVFNIQKHNSPKFNDTASMILAETLPPPVCHSKSEIKGDDSTIPIPELHSLDRPQNLQQPSSDKPSEVWGSIQTKSDPQDYHSIFGDSLGGWITTESLYDTF